MIFSNPNRKKGYTLLFAIIVATVVLAVAAFIVSVSRKQFILASTARDSLVAIYAADSGIQCAVQADAALKLEPSKGVAEIACNGTLLTGTYSEVNSVSSDFVSDVLIKTDEHAIYQTPPMTLVLPDAASANKVCATIKVTDGYNDKDVHVRIIESRGYNTFDGTTCGEPNPRAIERAIWLVYRGG